MNNRRVFLIIVLGLVLLAALWMPTPGKAEEIRFGDNVPEGQVFDQNMILNGTDVSIDGTVNGDVLAYGRSISVNGKVNGSLVVFGDSININGEVVNSLLAGGVKIELGPDGIIGRDIFFAGARLTLAEDSSVLRDLYCLSLEARLSGEIGRNVHAIVGPLQIAELLLGPLQGSITGSGAFLQEGDMQVNAPLLRGMGSGILSPASYFLAGGQRATLQAAQIDTERLQSWGIDLLRNLVTLLLLGLLAIWLMPAPLKWTGEKIQRAPWLTVLSGLTLFVGGWFVAILAFALILALAIFLFSISLPNLGFLFGALGLLGLGLCVAVFWLLIAYVSKLIVAFLVGRLLMGRFAPRYSESNLWPLLLGVVLYALLASIPYLGFVVATLVTFFGLGAIWVTSFPLFPRQNEVESVAVEVETD